jgi:Cu2+-exporting ATPase
MQQNLWLAVIFNAIAVPSPSRAMLIAALAVSGSSALVTLNALRARGRGGLT